MKTSISKPKIKSRLIDSNPDAKPRVTGGWINSSTGKKNDWSFPEAYQNHSIKDSNGSRPAALDLRNEKGDEWWDINEQDGNHSCVGWAVADLLRWHFVKSGNLADSEKLSVKYLWMAAKETDEIMDRPTTFLGSEGSTIKAALDVARKYGVVTEGFFPNREEMFPGSATEFYARASLLKISCYINLFDDEDISKDRKREIREIWKSWIFDNGPIIVRIKVDKSWCTDAGKCRFDMEDYKGEIVGGHAALLIGYTEEGDFIVRNSWGRNWGDKGYTLISEDYADEVIDEAYGVYTPENTKIIKIVGMGINPRSRAPGT